MPKKRTKKQKSSSNLNGTQKRTKKRTAIISEQEPSAVTFDDDVTVLDAPSAEQDPLLLISPVKKAPVSSVVSESLIDMHEPQQNEENKENDGRNTQAGMGGEHKQSMSVTTSPLETQHSSVDYEQQEDALSVDEANDTTSVPEPSTHIKSSTTDSFTGTSQNTSTTTTPLPTLPDLSELIQLVSELQGAELPTTQPSFGTLLPQITQLLQSFKQLKEHSAQQDSSTTAKALRTAQDEILQLREETSNKDAEIKELRNKLHHWETEFDEQCREVETNFKKEKNELNNLLEMERADSEQCRRTIEQLEDEVQEYKEKLNASFTQDTRENGINTSFQSVNQQQNQQGDQTDDEEELERLNERIDHLLQEQKDYAMHVEALEQELAKQKSQVQKLHMERDVYQKKYLHHAFLSIKLKLNSAEFNAKSIPDLVEEAFESSVSDQDLNSWLMNHQIFRSGGGLRERGENGTHQ